ncbi:GNAT family N-acetyltransferase [Nocardioides faecalis]|uniref:GNAT family N-acetyltransferase n=1 Tax=Nocardioides faecalis TaxID=2803858 RepID=UPI0020C00387|nr:GNAT family N-acetyltransferase [Nocardioides faecalis]
MSAPAAGRSAHVRPATEGDIDAVAAIYATEVREGTATFDLEPPPRAKWQQMLASAHPGDHFVVAEEDGVVLGYAYSTAYRTRGAYTHTREVSVYLDPAATGRGLGRLLYDDLLARLAAGGTHTALACITLPNPASEGLHRACGFEPVGVMREVGLKHDRWIDVAWWQRMLDAPPLPPTPAPTPEAGR